MGFIIGGRYWMHWRNARHFGCDFVGRSVRTTFGDCARGHRHRRVVSTGYGVQGEKYLHAERWWGGRSVSAVPTAQFVASGHTEPIDEITVVRRFATDEQNMGCRENCGQHDKEHHAAGSRVGNESNTLEKCIERPDENWKTYIGRIAQDFRRQRQFLLLSGRRHYEQFATTK